MNESKATRYQRERRRAHVGGVIAGSLVLGVLALTPAGGILAAWAQGVVASWPRIFGFPVGLALFIGACALLCEIAWLPALWYLSSRVNSRYGRRTDRRAVLAVHGQAMLVGVATALVAGAAGAIESLVGGPWWWLIASAVLAAA